MSCNKFEWMLEILNRHANYATIDTIVESGAADAAFAMQLRNLFDNVHTIEYSESLYEKVVTRFGRSKVHFHHGDSPTVLADLANDLPFPCVFYLDAHYCEGYGGLTAGQYDFPLWKELDVIRRRRFADIVVVDDVHTFGVTRGQMWGNWENVSPKSITAALDQRRVFDNEIIGNECVVYRNGDRAMD